MKAQDCDGKTTLMVTVVPGRGRLVCDVVAGDDGGRASAHGWACGVGEGVQDTAAAMVDATTDARLALALMAGARVELHLRRCVWRRCQQPRPCVQVVAAKPSLTSQELYAAVGCSVRGCAASGDGRGSGDGVQRRGGDDCGVSQLGLTTLGAAAAARC